MASPVHDTEPSERRDVLRIDSTERRLDGSVRLMRFGAVLCALFAATGIAHGIHDANPDGGWLIPCFAGIVAAAGFAGLWHVLIGAITGMVRWSMIVGIFAAGIVLTAVALGASAQSIATAISGRASMSAELAQNVDTYSQALADAYREATLWSAVPNAATAKAAGLELQAEMEASGANGKGSGQGPRYASLMNIAQSFRTGAEQLNAKFTEAGATRDTGNEALSALRDAAAHADQGAFMDAAGRVTQAIETLNTVDPMPIVHSVGAVVASEKAIDLSSETQEFYAAAEKSIADRKQIMAPTFAPFSMGDATRREIFGAAMHGWILAGAIDVLPFLCLIVAFFMSREVWHNEEVERRRLTPMGRDVRDRRVLGSMRGKRGGRAADQTRPTPKADRPDQAA